MAERGRQTVSQLAKPVAKRAAPRPIQEDEYAGTIDKSLDEIETLLKKRGFIRNLLSRLKTRDGDPEVGSWVYREEPRAEYQLHVMLFPGEGDTVDVYAHHEYSSVNSDVAYKHFSGQALDPKRGVEMAREKLPIGGEG
ncbi:hypothetical protein HTIA_2206 [Halorhabdus tiamatea SARL4B]|uniref:Uncharacterized protein n=1 Tax=Halorhabdus tiamatea SARL4B TaxID=1033806 RepID=S6D1P1_9EURY|nr:hypothetical protein HTIA_2206 [Halorhabdus tiamatea SARL4B]